MKKRRTKVIVCPDAHLGHHTLDLTPPHTHTISLFISSVDYTGFSSS